MPRANSGMRQNKANASKAADITFHSMEHALAVYMIANQYGADVLKWEALQYIDSNTGRYAASIKNDIEKCREIFLLADTLKLLMLKVAFISTSLLVGKFSCCVQSNRIG